MELLAQSSIFSNIPYILEFLVGLSVIVFVHELGHFLVAKWVGIKVEQFAFGFGKRLFGIKWGETDYRVNLIPLGGYVKMLGQEDFKPLTPTDKPDPRAFDQKSVGARFAVISAGVVMNIILAAVLFIIVGLAGKKFQAPVIGQTAPGSPAANAVVEWEDQLVAASQAATAPVENVAAAATQPSPLAKTDPWDPHLQGGDRIVRLEGDSWILALGHYRINHFQYVMMTSMLATPKEKYTFYIERTVSGVTRRGKATVGVQFVEGVMQFGMGGAADTVVLKSEGGRSLLAPFKVDDHIVAIDGQSVQHSWDIERISKSLTGRPVTVTVKRDGKDVDLQMRPQLLPAPTVFFLKDGQIVRSTSIKRNAVKDEAVSFDVTADSGAVRTIKKDDVSTEQLLVLGMSPRLKVHSVLEGTSADKAGMQPGDIVVRYGDQDHPTFTQLMDINNKNAGRKTTITVLRDGKELELTVKPSTKRPQATIGIATVPDEASPVVAGVLGGSPAAKAGLPAGATITQINGRAVSDWNDMVTILGQESGKEIDLAYTLRGHEQHKPLGVLTTAEFQPGDYEYSPLDPMPQFGPLTVEIKMSNPAVAMAWGGRETLRMIVSSYASLRSLVMGYASTKQVSGPVGLGAMAVQAAQQNFIDFVYLFAFISAAIAVFNFLPIPVVDGGHAVFLLIEKIRGRPVPLKIMNMTQLIGMVLLMLLFVAITFNDIRRMISG